MLNDSVVIAVLAELNFANKLAETLVRRLVSRLNRLVLPNITIIFGDISDDGLSSDSEEKLFSIKSILDTLISPYIVIPDNSNFCAEKFFKIFTVPETIKDICGIRFISFGPEENNCNSAVRSHKILSRFRQAGNNYSGPIVALTKSCLFAHDRAETPYRIEDSERIISSMKETETLWFINSNYHKGSEGFKDGNVNFINAPGLCEPPFPYTVVNISRGQVKRERQELAMDENLQLSDNHIHTQLAYCNDNITVDKAIAQADVFGLSGISFTEHSGQLYFDSKGYWAKDCLKSGINSARDGDNRMNDYLNLKKIYQGDSLRFGLEVDCDYRGNLILKDKDRSHFDFIIGAMHGLPGVTRDRTPYETDSDEYLSILEKLLRNNIDVLAHPFRVFRRCGRTAPEGLFLPTAKLLRKYNTAAEINFHTNEPPIEFIRTCLNMGVRFSLGSDAHELAEIGDFAYHLALLKEAGFDGDLKDILLPL